MKTSRFAPAKNVYEVDQELGGGELSLSVCPGWEIDLQEKKNKQIKQISGGITRGHGYKSNSTMHDTTNYALDIKLSPPRRLPLGIPIKIAIIVQIQKRAGNDGKR